MLFGNLVVHTHTLKSPQNYYHLRFEMPNSGFAPPFGVLAGSAVPALVSAWILRPSLALVGLGLAVAVTIVLAHSRDSFQHRLVAVGEHAARGYYPTFGMLSFSIFFAFFGVVKLAGEQDGEGWAAFSPFVVGVSYGAGVVGGVLWTWGLGRRACVLPLLVLVAIGRWEAAMGCVGGVVLWSMGLSWELYAVAAGVCLRGWLEEVLDVGYMEEVVAGVGDGLRQCWGGVGRVWTKEEVRAEVTKWVVVVGGTVGCWEVWSAIGVAGLLVAWVRCRWVRRLWWRVVVVVGALATGGWVVYLWKMVVASGVRAGVREAFLVVGYPAAQAQLGYVAAMTELGFYMGAVSMGDHLVAGVWGIATAVWESPVAVTLTVFLASAAGVAGHEVAEGKGMTWALPRMVVSAGVKTVAGVWREVLGPRMELGKREAKKGEKKEEAGMEAVWEGFKSAKEWVKGVVDFVDGQGEGTTRGRREGRAGGCRTGATGTERIAQGVGGERERGGEGDVGGEEKEGGRAVKDRSGGALGGGGAVMMRGWRTVGKLKVVRTLPHVSAETVGKIREVMRSGVLVQAGPEMASAALGLAMRVRGKMGMAFGQLMSGRVDWVEEELGRMHGGGDEWHGGGADWRRKAEFHLQEGRAGKAKEVACERGGEVDGSRVEEYLEALFPKAVVGMGAPVVTRADLVDASGVSKVRVRVAKGDKGMWEEAVREAIREADGTASPGVTGFRVAWLKQAVALEREPRGTKGSPRGGSGGQTVVGTVAQWVEGMMAGGAGTMLSTVLLRLIPKPGKDGARPIGVGEPIAAVAKRVVASALRASTEGWLQQRGQWGVGTRDGCRMLAAGVAGLWEDGWSVLGLDVENAFNSVHRKAVVEAVAARDGELAPFVAFSLQPTVLVGGHGERVVDRGVVQGDPLSPLLFSLVMGGVAERVVERCRERGVRVGLLVPGDVHRVRREAKEGKVDAVMGWYADDGTVAWRSGAVLEVVVEVVRVAMEEVGMVLSQRKCRVVAGKGADDGEVEDAGRSLGMEKVSAMKVVGVPVGEVQAAREILMGLVEGAAGDLKKLWALESPLGEVAVLRAAGLGSAIKWAFEAAPEGMVTEEMLAEVEAREDELFRHVFGAYGDRVDESMLLQAAHPVKAGGLGLVRFGRLGRLVGGRWVVRTEVEMKEFDKMAADKIRAGLPARSVGWKRWVERSGVEDCLKWVDSGVAMKEVRSQAERFNLTTQDVASTMLMTLMGGEVWPGDLEGVVCPMTHQGGAPCMCYGGRGAHHEQCNVVVKAGRHAVVQQVLFEELGKVGEVRKEVSPTPSGKVVARSYTGDSKGEKFPGDVMVTLKGGKRWWLDCTVSAVSSSDSLDRLQSAAEVAFGRKREAWVRYFKECKESFLPVAISTSGAIARVTSAELRKIIGEDGVMRVTASAVVAQTIITQRILHAARVYHGRGGGAMGRARDLGNAVARVIDDDDSSDGGDVQAAAAAAAGDGGHRGAGDGGGGQARGRGNGGGGRKWGGGARGRWG